MILIKSIVTSEVFGLFSVLFLDFISANTLLALEFPQKTPKQIRDALVKFAIVRRILPHAPKLAVEVAYGEHIVDLGNSLTAEQIENEPTHISWPALSDSFYTLVFSGPDVPTHEKSVDKEIQHWVVGNIPGNNVSAGDRMTQYKGITPLYEPGSHRMCFYVYEQPDKRRVKFKDALVNETDGGYKRAFFHAEVLRSKYNYPEAIAANFFIVKTT